jgi:hypothetical protein
VRGRRGGGLLVHDRATIDTRTGAWSGQRGRVQGDAFIDGWGSARCRRGDGALEVGRGREEGLQWRRRLLSS